MDNRLKELKKKLNITSKQMAADLNISKYSVDSWMNQTRHPRPSTVRLIEAVYGLKPGWLSGKTDQMFTSSEEEERRKRIREIMNCQSDYAIDTMCRLSEASDLEWSVLEELFPRK